METDKNKIIDELKEISPLLIDLKKKDVYKVSSSYFNSVSISILNKIETDNELSFTKNNPFSLPASYFSSLNATIMQKIKKNEIFEELEAVSPLLNKVSKTAVYSLPADYFQNITIPTQEKLSVVEKSNVFSLKRIVFSRYLAAAMIATLLGVGMFLFTGKKHTNSEVNTAQISPAVNKLSEQEIIDFLKTTAPAENVASNSTVGNGKDSDIKSSVSKMSDNEIQQFLIDNGDQDEM